MYFYMKKNNPPLINVHLFKYQEKGLLCEYLRKIDSDNEESLWWSSSWQPNLMYHANIMNNTSEGIQIKYE